MGAPPMMRAGMTPPDKGRKYPAGLTGISALGAAPSLPAGLVSPAGGPGRRRP